MDKIEHKYIDIRGLKLHVAEIGTGPSVVVFLHGFPEIWYSWRHQMIAVANAGYRALAPDFRGYGLSQLPPEPEKASFKDLIEDLLAILDSFSIPKAFLIGKDFGAIPANLFAVVFPDRVSGVITMGVPHLPPNPSSLFSQLPEGFYILRWKEPGRAEADFGRFNVKTVVRNIYILFSGSELPIAGQNQEIMDLVDPSTPLPSWFTEEDLAVYATLYEKSGFRTPLQIPYRTLHEDMNLTDPRVKVPALLIMGGKDYFLNVPGMEDYVRSGKVKDLVPELEITFLEEGTHFVQEQFPDQAFIVGKDFGAFLANLFAVLFPERVSGLVTLGIPYVPSQPSSLFTQLPEGLYVLRWQEPGRAEADFGRFDIKTVVRNIYILFSGSEIPIAGKNQEVMDLVDLSSPLPPWFTEDDLAVYATLYEKSGFRTPLQVPYRSLQEDFGLTDPTVKVPALLIMGGKDYSVRVPGMEDYVRSGKVKDFVPDLETTFLPEGTHFVQEQFPDQVNQLITTFLRKHTCSKSG